MSSCYSLLDLFCGAGGAARGYADAGFLVTGIDINPQPNYPYRFIQRDALTLDYEFLSQFDFIHASPPCQAYSRASALARRGGKTYPDLVDPTRLMLAASGKPYVMENVLGSPVRPDIALCGSMFGLGVLRHRYFETNTAIRSQLTCNHTGTVKGGDYVTVAGNGGHGEKRFSRWADAMGIDWMTRDELKESIPPAFTKWIGLEALLILAPGSFSLNPTVKYEQRRHNAPAAFAYLL